MLKHLQELCNLCGCSGDESEIRQYIIRILERTNGVSWEIDPLGNLLVQKRGASRAPHRLMVSAHMDEVGLIVTHIFSDGTLSVAAVGGVDASVVIGRQVLVGKNHIPGVIGVKPVHLLTDEEKKMIPEFGGFVLDIGAENREQAEEIAPPGTYVYFMLNFRQFGKECICSKAIDDRVGCALLLYLLEQETPYDFTGAFLVQEEIGLRGAKTAAYTVAPDFALVLEATTAADLVDAKEDEKVCTLGKGPVISFMDYSTIYDSALVQMAFSIGKVHDISCQTKSRIAGGNDSGAIHLSRGGVRTLSVSLPCRYLHSPASVANLADIDALSKFLPLLVTQMLQIPHKDSI
ncbi:MAG: M42 family peptidase [Ruminococcus sp.]|nr:M42 family peptidase [Ruminococcus sp.]